MMTHDHNSDNNSGSLSRKDGTTERLLDIDATAANNSILDREFEALHRQSHLLSNENDTGEIVPDFPDISSLSGNPYADLVSKLNLNVSERILLLLALEAHYNPSYITARMKKLKSDGSAVFKSMNYYNDVYSGNYYPTLQTAIFFCAGGDASKWRSVERELLFEGKLFKEQIIILNDPDERGRVGNRLNHLLDLAPEYVDYFLHGRKPRPDFGRGFPARLVSTNLTWDHLVLNRMTRTEIDDVMDWVAHGKDVLDRSEGQVNNSFPVLFYGPPGTGKSFTAKLIGKQYGKDVFRIDLSMIVSKYIGETEKNLAHLFDRAEGKDWILFFDEADSLFGKRTGISDSKDKWANLEMSYLLQRMEDYSGLCILASNLKNNLDAALARRFQAVIHFPFPKKEERGLIWRKSLPPGFKYAQNISIEKLAQFELSGAGIANVIKSSCTKAAKRGNYYLEAQDISRFIKIEFAKDGRTV